MIFSPFTNDNNVQLKHEPYFDVIMSRVCLSTHGKASLFITQRLGTIYSDSSASPFSFNY